MCHHWAVVLICIGDHCTDYHTQCRVDSSARHSGLLQTTETFAGGERTLRVPDKPIPICNAPLTPVVQLELRTYKHEIVQSTQEKQKHEVAETSDNNKKSKLLQHWLVVMFTIQLIAEAQQGQTRPPTILWGGLFRCPLHLDPPCSATH